MNTSEKILESFGNASKISKPDLRNQVDAMIAVNFKRSLRKGLKELLSNKSIKEIEKGLRSGDSFKTLMSNLDSDDRVQVNGYVKEANIKAIDQAVNELTKFMNGKLISKR